MNAIIAILTRFVAWEKITSLNASATLDIKVMVTIVRVGEDI